MKKFLVVLSFVVISLAQGQITNTTQEAKLSKETQQPITTQEIEYSKENQELITTKNQVIQNTPQETNTIQDLKDTIPNEIWQKLEDIKQINTLNDEQREFIFNKYYDYYKYKPKKYDTPFKDTGFFHKNIKQVVGKKYDDDDFLFYVYGFGEAAGSFDYFVTPHKKLDKSRKNAVREGNATFYTIKDDTKEVFLECMKEKNNSQNCLDKAKEEKLKKLYLQEIISTYHFNIKHVTPNYVKKYFGDAMGDYAEPENGEYISDYIYGFLYISRFPCGLHNFYGMQCSEDDYSVSFFLTYNPPAFYEGDTTGCGNYATTYIGCNNSKGSHIKYIVPIDYDKIKPLLSDIDINNELNKNQYFTIPVKLRPKAIVCGYNESKNTSDLYDEDGSFTSSCGMRIDKIVKTNNYKKVKEYIKKYDCDKKCPKDDETCQSEKTCACFKDLKDFDFFLYPRSNDIYVNVREKPNAKSKVVAKVFTHYKKDKKYSYDNDVYYVKDLKLLIMNKELVSNEIKNTHKNIIEIDRFYSKAKVINGWWDVSFKDNNGKIIKGYVYKSELSYGVGLVSYKTCGFWGIESDE